jgi:hypothetical protein
MLRIKLAAVLILLPGAFASVAMAQEQLLVNHANSIPSSQLLQTISMDLTSAPDSDTTTGESSSIDSSEGFVRTVPSSRPVRQPLSQKPFRTVAFGIKATTAGAGAELATPLFHSFNLRSGFNFLTFSYPFGIDGVNYNAQMHLRSSQTTLDWFPTHHGFHISPGIFYSKNALSALASVPPGQYFELGDQSFTNSVDDPLRGTMSVVYPHNLSPMLLLGFGNILPRSSHHLSVPFEFGAAYTGAPTINVNLNGTACTNDGCVSVANNAEAQSSLRQEIQTLNEDLKKVPVYPILSLGVAYHFWSPGSQRNGMIVSAQV